MFANTILKRAFSAAPKNRVAFLGVGNMGKSMVLNLQKNGFQVKAYDVFAPARKACEDSGIYVADSMEECVKDVDFCVSALPMTAHVQEAMATCFANANPGTQFLDASTILPKASIELAEIAEKAGMVFMDTPMSGGILGAKNGTLSFMCGGSDADLASAMPVLEGMGKNIFHCGPRGQGGVAKLTNNLILGLQMIAVSEALSIGEKLGGDPIMLSDIYSVSTGRCYAVDTYSPVPGYKEASPATALNYMGGFMTKLIKKDMGLAVQAAKDGGAHCHETQRAFEMYSKMDDMGLGDHDFSYVYQFFKADFTVPKN